MVNPISEFKNFILTQNFSDGVKITLGVLLPSLVFFQFSQLEVGIMLSLGALCVSIADSPGPWIHRKTGMLFTILFTFLTALITGSLNTHPYLLAAEIFLLCFFFAMFNVYGVRAASVGTAALLVMVLNISSGNSSLKLFELSLLILGGGIWYFLLSTIFSIVRPYRYAQQTLGESIAEVAKYMRMRARFYQDEVPVDDNFKDLVIQQVSVNELQDNVREAIFKTRKLMNESTNAGRLMIRIFVDTVDLFEQIMATNNDYESIRSNYKQYQILPHFATVIIKLSEEIEYIGFCLIHQEKPRKHAVTVNDLNTLKVRLDELEKSGVPILILKKILINLRNIFHQVNDILQYFQKETKDLQSSSTPAELSRFVNHQSFDFKIFINNLNLKSAAFRFSLRLAIVCLIGFYVGKLFSLGHHSYWILLTILVIMKPGFSNTKQRNSERVIGTLIGGIIGSLILTFIHDETVKFFLLLLFMLITYSFIRVKYVVSVIFMTPFILILFSFINSSVSTTAIAGERIIDTLIGSFLALVFSYILLPGWESLQFRAHLSLILESNLNYLEHIILRQSTLPVALTDYKLARKAVYVHTANLAAAFQRMLNEPKNKQRQIKEVHKFVVLNHILSSYLANLSADFSGGATIDAEQMKLIRKSRFYLKEAIEKVSEAEQPKGKRNKLHILLSEAEADPQITGQLELITKISADLCKISGKL